MLKFRDVATLTSSGRHFSLFTVEHAEVTFEALEGPGDTCGEWVHTIKVRSGPRSDATIPTQSEPSILTD